MNTSKIISLCLLLAGPFFNVSILAQNFNDTQDVGAGLHPSVEAHSITVRSYATFLNAVAGIGDIHGLYNEAMEGQILQTSEGGECNYISISNDEQDTLLSLTLLDAMRYCNWLENSSLSENGDKTTEAAVVTSTENGSYVLQDNQVISTNPDATYHLVNTDSNATTFEITTSPVSQSLSQSSSPLMMFQEEEQKAPAVSESDPRIINRGDTRSKIGADSGANQMNRGTAAGFAEQSPGSEKVSVLGDVEASLTRQRQKELQQFIQVRDQFNKGTPDHREASIKVNQARSRVQAAEHSENRRRIKEQGESSSPLPIAEVLDHIEQRSTSFDETASMSDLSNEEHIDAKTIINANIRLSFEQGITSIANKAIRNANKYLEFYGVRAQDIEKEESTSSANTEAILTTKQNESEKKITAAVAHEEKDEEEKPYQLPYVDSPHIPGLSLTKQAITRYTVDNDVKEAVLQKYAETPTELTHSHLKSGEQIRDNEFENFPLISIIADVSNNRIITLRKFITAIQKNPSAKRLLIEEKEDGLSVEVSRSWNPRRLLWSSSDDKEKNQRVATELKNALLTEYQDKGEAIRYFIDQSFLQNNTADWSASKIYNLIQTIDERAEPTVAPTSKEDASRYSDARVIEIDEIDGSEPGQKIRRQILKTLDKTEPYIRIEEVIDPVTGISTHRKKMAADHLLVTLKKGEDPEVFHKQLQSNLLEVNAYLKTSIKKTISVGRLCYLYIKPISLKAFSQVLETTKHLNVISGPDYISARTLATYFPKDKLYRNQWNLHGPYGISAPSTWEKQAHFIPNPLTIIDTGIHHTHDDLAANIANSKELRGCDFVNPPSLPIDADGHGTHCGGIIGAIHNNIGIAGILRNTQLIGCKVSDNKGDMHNGRIIESIIYSSSKGIKILNCSLGDNLNKDNVYPAGDIIFLESLKDVSGEDTMFVAAAGNDAKNNDVFKPYPASYALSEINPNGANNVVVVAATDQNGELWRNPSDLNEGSNYGKKTVHLAAPGVDIWSTYIRTTPTWNLIHTENDAYKCLTGTSMATPHVTAALDLMKSEFPNVSHQNIIARLLATTDPILTLKRKDDPKLAEIPPTDIRELNNDYSIVLNEHTMAGRLNLAHALRKDLSGMFGHFSNDSSLPSSLYLTGLEASDSSLPGMEMQQNSFTKADAAICLRNKAQEEGIIANFLKNKALAAHSPTEGDALWTQATEKVTVANAAWNETVKTYQEGLRAAPDGMAFWWQQEVENAGSEQAIWKTNIPKWENERRGRQQCTIM